jgi:hypothetical protein
VSLRKCPDQGLRIPRTVRSALFAGLALCVREVEFIGWYRDQDVAGAVLAQGLESDSDAPVRIIERVRNELSQRLPSRFAERPAWAQVHHRHGVEWAKDPGHPWIKSSRGETS